MHGAPEQHFTIQGVSAQHVAMRGHPDGDSFQNNAGDMLGELAKTEAHRAAIVAAGAIPLATAAVCEEPVARRSKPKRVRLRLNISLA